MSRAKDPKIINESQKIFGTIKKVGTAIIIVLVVVIVFLLLVVKTKKEGERKKEATPAVQHWQLCWEKNPDTPTDTPTMQKCMPAIVKKDGDSLFVFYRYDNGKKGNIEGKKTSSSTYDGILNDNGGWGNFHLRVVSSDSAVGWVDNKGNKPINLWLVAN